MTEAAEMCLHDSDFSVSVEVMRNQTTDGGEELKDDMDRQIDREREGERVLQR